MGSWDSIRELWNLVPTLAGQLLVQPVCLLSEENSWNRQCLNYFSRQRHAGTIVVFFIVQTLEMYHPRLTKSEYLSLGQKPVI